jgi:hypothetical protein
MITPRKFLVYLALVVALLLASAPAPSSAGDPRPENKVPKKVESTAKGLADRLERQGYEVSRGYFKLYTHEDCDSSYAVLGTCYGNNPAAPYVQPVVRPWPDEYVDPHLAGVFGPTAAGYATTFRFAPREAIVILGVLPPPAAYFGLQTYLFTRQGEIDTNSAQYQLFAPNPYMLQMFFSTVPNEPERVQAFSSLSNSNNNVVIERQSGTAWDQVRYFVITPDRSMDDVVREALSTIGIQGKDIFTEPIPGDMKIGLDAGADDFVPFIRYAMPRDGGDSAKWRKDLPLVVLRIRDPRPEAQPQRYPQVRLEPRTAVNEQPLSGQLAELVSAVKAKWGGPSDADQTFYNVQPRPIYLVGPKCTPIGMDCLGDTQDTAYEISARLPVDQGQVYAAVGTLAVGTGDPADHTTRSTGTGNATYVGLGVNGTLRIEGIGNIDNNQLAGSAGSYGVADPAFDPNKFFVQYFTRDCTGLEALTGGHCFSIPETMLPYCANPSDPSCDLLGLSVREYIRPGTQRGPDAAKVLPPVVITLHRP